MPRKPKPRREPTPAEEGAEILVAAEKAGADYAQEQVGSEHFRDWVYDQMVEAEKMRKADPSSVIPLETPADAKRVAKSMLKQLEWDTSKQMEARDVFDLAGAAGVFGSGSASWVRDTYGITASEVTKAFFDGFREVLESPSTREWLADEVLVQSENVRGVGVMEVAHRRLVRAEPQDPQVYLSFSDGKYRVIRQGSPISADKTTSEEALQVARQFGLKVAGDMWNGDIGQWVPLWRSGARESGRRRAGGSTATESRRRTVVRDFIAVDPSGRTVAGPFTDYTRAKTAAAKARGYVKFAAERRRPVHKRSR
jgi:hypothetical protein